MPQVRTKSIPKHCVEAHEEPALLAAEAAAEAEAEAEAEAAAAADAAPPYTHRCKHA